MKIGKYTITTAMLITIIGVTVLLGAVAYAAVTIWSNNVIVTPLAIIPTSISLTVNTTTPYVGEAILLTATLDIPADGVTVNFYGNTGLIGSVVTAGGVATLERTISNTTPKTYNCSITV